MNYEPSDHKVERVNTSAKSAWKEQRDREKPPRDWLEEAMATQK